MIEFNHAANKYSRESPLNVLGVLLPQLKPKNILDVGCGKGTWLRAAIDLGVSDVLGIDGVPVPPELLLFPPQHLRQIDLTTAWSLDRKYDLVMCLEVAEHLEEKFASTLVGSLTRHADTILFSAASPYQPGQHHVNCQWPGYWQQLFNRQGYACDDTIRIQLWETPLIDPWYRQNMFIAKKNPEMAGAEPRLHAYAHPDLLPYMFENRSAPHYQKILKQLGEGHGSVSFYLSLPFRACFYKLKRFLRRRSKN